MRRGKSMTNIINKNPNLDFKPSEYINNILLLLVCYKTKDLWCVRYILSN